jgi:acyl-CoA synthetase (AMP-forming)/AMP-acid ligase II
MRDVPTDGVSMGEIIMRGNNVMKGVFADEEATNAAFRTAGSIPAASVFGILTGMSSCATGARTSSSPAGRMLAERTK